MRLNKPKVPAGATIVKAVGDWTLYQVDEEQYRLVANKPVEQKANYSLIIKGNQLASGQDNSRLRRDRPALYAELEVALGGPEALAQDDPYGDIAIRGNRPITAEQKWKRRRLNFRRQYFANSVICTPPVETDCALACNALFTPIFGRKPTAEEIAEFTAYATKGHLPHPEAFLEASRHYYDGDWAPYPCARLEEALDMISGAFEFGGLM